MPRKRAPKVERIRNMFLWDRLVANHYKHDQDDFLHMATDGVIHLSKTSVLELIAHLTAWTETV